jgi:hypothetical protein
MYVNDHNKKSTSINMLSGEANDAFQKILTVSKKSSAETSAMGSFSFFSAL